MRKIKLKQGGLVTFFIDGITKLALVCPWLKYVVDNLVDYYRFLLLKGKDLHCPVCLSSYIVRNGHDQRLFGSPVQNYLCKNCYKQFCENIFHRFYRYKYPICFILLSLDLKKRGNAITQILDQIFIPFSACFLQPCYATITRWIMEFGQIAIDKVAKIKLKAGRRKHWEIDEEYDSRIVETKENRKYVKNGKKKAGSFCLIDPHTKLISLEPFDFNLSKIARSTLLKTMYKWQTKPRSIWKDGWGGYDTILEELEIPHGVVIHTKEWKSKKGHHNNTIEREWSEKRTWIKQCRGFATFDGRAFYDKFYEMTRNFFSPRRVLNEITPAEKAGLQENITFLTLMK
jgi:transposase-like protein